MAKTTVKKSESKLYKKYTVIVSKKNSSNKYRKLKKIFYYVEVEKKGRQGERSKKKRIL